ncbi:NAD-dependent succinate-semialdehyde dehydrogenase [Acidiphilium sp. AL]|uniref:NAD-dependent succinate-semialdehyde dehydrogenase n=1 Tax=Acidiphilium iwatense TaxID=768198 RepID=A0ABS9DVU5_9PROT|nr:MULTISPECIES: NAD-dependent succinate-semialdehyde dehydrogenase [Acidiphilium]MCF3945464.1 NAD-dependent succinate-semialdehyde dehydrogenase [Acidiphilium iwatense]MCU4158980.1 NAD-dependent succinate-semialdehyde dehydrogenase [Acidiphilium sp. AL]
MYQDVMLHIGGEWTGAKSGRTLDVLNPATEEKIGTAAHAERADLDAAIAAAETGFVAWRKTSPQARAKIMRKAANLIRERADTIARTMTMEQGKPLPEAKGETLLAADVIDWFAEEAPRTYGRVIPARADGVYQLVVKEPVGIVAAFTPWNFPLNQAVRKVSAAIAAGCAVILKGPEETPGSCAELVRAFADAGLPAGVLNLVYGVPAEISEYLIPHHSVRKISFTGSTVVGKHLASLAGKHMKRATMELGGHAPAIVFEDADLDAAAKILAANKFRNAGQVCVAPTRFLVQDSVYDGFMERFLGAVAKIKVGDGLEAGTTMGPLANERRIPAIEGFIADARQHGAKVAAGGERIGNKGYFFQPTVMTDVPVTARAMNEEPFGPLALVNRFASFDDAIAEANRLDFGLAAYAYTRSTKTVTALGHRIESGMVSINHHGLALPETPFGGMKDSGYGWEGGAEAIDSYLATKFVTQAS